LALLLLLALFNINTVRRQVYPYFPALRARLDESLIQAVQRGDVERARVLLERGADPDSDVEAAPLLLDAVERDSFQMAMLLLQYGANPNRKPTTYDDTPFITCMERRKSTELALAMIKHGAHVQAHSSNGDPIFFQAVHSRNRKLIEAMLNRGVSVNTQTTVTPGSTALLLIIEGPASRIDKETLELVRFLLARGANPNIRSPNNSNMTPFLSAVCMFYGDPVTLSPIERTIIVDMIKAGGNVNEEIWEGLTPLMMAVHRRDAFIVSQLLQAGAKVNARADDGDTALIIARREKQEDIVELLKQAGAKG
jgi:ankyrin repeat protein